MLRGPRLEHHAQLELLKSVAELVGEDCDEVRLEWFGFGNAGSHGFG